jgi:ATP-dependent exoDNAse (exonuclease V) alpha subunit
MTKGSHGDYYTANDDSGWAIFSPTGDLMCSFQWPMDERLTMYLNPVLEYAKGYKGFEAKESDLYFYEDSIAVPTRGEHDIVDEEQKYLSSLSKMNAGQKQAFSALIDCLHDGSGVLFLDGPAGTGKTFIIRAFISYIYSKHKKPIIVASTGLAASLYEEGCTAHSMFKIPFCVNNKTVCALDKSWRTKLFREADILIWDEAVCIEKDAVEAVERGFKELRADQRVFGGLLVVFCGDFRQVLPVIQKSALENTIQQSIFWQHTKILRLSENMRAKDDTRFASLLMEIGNGVLDSVTIPPCCTSSSLDELITFVFPQFEERLYETGYFENRAILAPTNYLVDKVNSILLKRIARKEKIYSWMESTKKRYKNDYIRERIALKVGCPVMILANLGHGLCNGTRMICMELGEETILGKVLTGVCAGKRVEISRIVTENKEQFPVALCFAMTINKAQGQTLDRVGLNLAAPVFAHGQLYCAFSRARSLDGVKVFAPENAVKNIVHKSILL